MNWRGYVAEGAGTAIVVLLGTMAAVGTQGAVGVDLIIESLGFGLGLLVALLAVGEVSGRHFNPAVTLAAYLDRRLPLPQLLMSWTAQAVGGLTAAATLLAMTDPATVDRAVTSSPDPFVAFGTELILAGVFVAVALASTRYAPYRMDAMLMMSLAYTGVHLSGLPFSGGSVNPARSLGPAVVAGDFRDIGVYVVAPLIGAIAGFAVFKGLGLPPEPETEPRRVGEA